MIVNSGIQSANLLGRARSSDTCLESESSDSAFSNIRCSRWPGSCALMPRARCGHREWVARQPERQIQQENSIGSRPLAPVIRRAYGAAAASTDSIRSPVRRGGPRRRCPRHGGHPLPTEMPRCPGSCFARFVLVSGSCWRQLSRRIVDQHTDRGRPVGRWHPLVQNHGPDKRSVRATSIPLHGRAHATNAAVRLLQPHERMTPMPVSYHKFRIVGGEFDIVADLSA
jgi:hypothetical protein